jgi:hypothetical protein
MKKDKKVNQSGFTGCFCMRDGCMIFFLLPISSFLNSEHVFCHELCVSIRIKYS